MQILDDLDKKIILALEKDARLSLKQLATELNIKTSTIYHRLHRLQESNILKGFTIELNPELLDIRIHALLTITIQNMMVGNLDSMFLNSFAMYLKEEFPNALFISIGKDSKIYLISAHKRRDDFSKFVEDLKKIPYVKDLKIQELEKLISGSRLYKFSNLKCK
ncbi:MAG: Lrp/AsnC family transcriptional regulator [Promethearchaeota archaeon]